MIFIQVLLLVFCYVVAIGFGVRIFLYHKTGNEKYKHEYNCWKSEYKPKHLERD